MSTKFKTENDYILWNEDMAVRYDPEAYHLRSSLPIRWIERRRVKAILKFLQTNTPEAVLEVGCGAGNVLEQVPSLQQYGIDLSTFLLKKSQTRLANAQARLAQANAERIPFANARFHKLICTEVLEHVPDPRLILSEMTRVATPDAVLVVSIPNEVWINRAKRIIGMFGLTRWLLQGEGDNYNSPEQMTDEWHLHEFDLSLLRKISKDILHIQQVKAIPFRFIPLRYVTRCRVLAQE